MKPLVAVNPNEGGKVMGNVVDRDGQQDLPHPSLLKEKYGEQHAQYRGANDQQQVQPRAKDPVLANR